jgi:hypothetical protein
MIDTKKICRFRVMSFGSPVCSLDTDGFLSLCYHEIDSSLCLWFREVVER